MREDKLGILKQDRSNLFFLFFKSYQEMVKCVFQIIKDCISIMFRGAIRGGGWNIKVWKIMSLEKKLKLFF